MIIGRISQHKYRWGGITYVLVHDGSGDPICEMERSAWWALFRARLEGLG